MADEPTNIDFLGLTARIVAAHAANNDLEPDELPAVIRSVYETLTEIGGGQSSPHAHVHSHDHSHAGHHHTHPAVPVEESVYPDYIVCLEDGKQLKMLKRHLATAYDLTPEQYRMKWGLPPDYPMVAPNYAAKRSALAKEIGLGTHRGDR